MTPETLCIGELRFQVRRSARRRSLGLTVDRGGLLWLHAPVDTTTEDLEQWARGRLLWVHRKLALRDSARSATGAVADTSPLTAGDSVFYLGQAYRLKFVAGQAAPIIRAGNLLCVNSEGQARLRAELRAWMEIEGVRWLGQRLDQTARRLGLRPTAFDVRDLGHRWGSCTEEGQILLNWRVLQLPLRLIDTIIVHELTHLASPRHDAEFRRRLNSYLPDAEARERELNVSGPGYLRL